VEDSFGTSTEPLLCVNSEACFIARRIHDFLVRQARRDLEAAVARHAAILASASAKSPCATPPAGGVVHVVGRAEFLCASSWRRLSCLITSRA